MNTEVDYIIVGFGLAGLCFAELLEQHQKSFVVIDVDNDKAASRVAGGLYNPVILKRFTPVWQAKPQMEYSIPFFKEIEKRIGLDIVYNMPVYRKLASVEEQNIWFEAADKPVLEEYLSTTIVKNKHSHIKADNGFGEVLQTGRLNIPILLETYKKKLIIANGFIEEPFVYKELTVGQENVSYKNIKAKKVVFAEGFYLKNNPFFYELPLDGTKGELLIINAPDLKIDFVLKSAVFLIPLGDDNYIVGATYDWKDKTPYCTEAAREELLTKLDKLIECDYKILNQVAAIRPTVVDRKPLVGQHPKHKMLYILNGLGTHGVLMAPWCALQLYNFIENNKPLCKEMNSSRFLESK